MLKPTAVSRLNNSLWNADTGMVSRHFFWIAGCCGINGIFPRAGSQMPFVRSQSSFLSQAFADPVPDYHLIRYRSTSVPDSRSLLLQRFNIFQAGKTHWKISGEPTKIFITLT